VCHNQRAERTSRKHALTSLVRFFPSVVSVFGCHLTTISNEEAKSTLPLNLFSWFIFLYERDWEFLESNNPFLDRFAPSKRTVVNHVLLQIR
jgi:hypothetical protein